MRAGVPSILLLRAISRHSECHFIAPAPRLKAGRARFQRRDVAADLLRIDLFEERPKDFLEKRVSPLFQLTNFSHRSSPRFSIPPSIRIVRILIRSSRNPFCKNPNP